MPIALFLGFKIVNEDYLKNTKNVLVLFSLIIILIITYFSFMKIEWSSEVSFIENLATIGYVIADFILLVPCVGLILMLFNGKYKRAWLFFTIGVLLFVIGDTLYAINYEGFESGSYIDLFWFYSYLAFALGLFCMKKTAEESLNLLKKR